MKRSRDQSRDLPWPERRLRPAADKGDALPCVSRRSARGAQGRGCRSRGRLRPPPPGRPARHSAHEPPVAAQHLACARAHSQPRSVSFRLSPGRVADGALSPPPRCSGRGAGAPRASRAAHRSALALQPSDKEVFSRSVTSLATDAPASSEQNGLLTNGDSKSLGPAGLPPRPPTPASRAGLPRRPPCPGEGLLATA